MDKCWYCGETLDGHEVDKDGVMMYCPKQWMAGFLKGHAARETREYKPRRRAQ